MDAFEKKLFDILRQHDPSTNAEQLESWSESQSYWASRNYRESALWIDRSFSLLDGGLEKVDVEKFIINAHGVVVDLPEYIEKKVGIFRLLGFESILEFRRYIIRQLRDRGMQVHLLCLLELEDAISGFTAKLAEETVFALIYYRNKYCHPVLSAYSVKLSRKKGGLVKFDPEKYEAFLKIQPCQEVDLCEELFKKFSENREALEKMRALLWRLKS